MEPKLFTPEFNEHAEDFKKYLPVNINLRYETVASHIALCEENFLRPVLGDALFNRAVNYVISHPALLTSDSLDAQLVNKMRFALIRLAIWQGYDVISSNISDTGVSAEVDKENRLYRYQEENIKNSLKQEGFNYIDSILEFLETNASTFTEFSMEEEPRIVGSTAIFNKYYNIDNSRLVFLKMKQYIRDVELIKLQHRIGAAFYQRLLTPGENNDLNAILPYVRNFVVYEAVADGIGELHKMPTERGLVFEVLAMDGVTVSQVVRAQIAETQQYFHQKAERYLASAINTITANPTAYPEYTAFAGDSPVDGIIRRDNTNRKTFLA